MKLIFLFLLVIAIGLSSGFELGKNQKEKSALKKSESMIVKTKSAKQFKELKRQDEPAYYHFPAYYHMPSVHDGFEPRKNQKEKSALKKLASMIVKAKSAKQFNELKRQNTIFKLWGVQVSTMGMTPTTKW